MMSELLNSYKELPCNLIEGIIEKNIKKDGRYCKEKNGKLSFIIIIIPLNKSRMIQTFKIGTAQLRKLCYVKHSFFFIYMPVQDLSFVTNA